MASLLSNLEHRNQEATVYVGNLDAACTEELLMELFTQVGPVVNVHMPKDKLRYGRMFGVVRHSDFYIS